MLSHFINMTLAGWDSLNAADCSLCSEMLLLMVPFHNVHIRVRIWLLRLLLVQKLRGWTTFKNFVVSVKVISTRIITIIVVVCWRIVLRARLKRNYLDLIRWLQIVIEVVLKVLLECTVLIDCIGLLISFRVLSCGTHFYIVSLWCLCIFPLSAGSYSTPTLLSLDRQVLLDHHELLIVVSLAVWLVCVAEARQVHLGELYVLRSLIEKCVIGILAIGCLITITLWKYCVVLEWFIVGQRRQRMIVLLIQLALIFFSFLLRVVLVERIAVRLLSDDDVIRILIHFAFFFHWYLMLALTS